MSGKGMIFIVMLFVGLCSFGQNTKTKPAAKTPQYVMHVVKFGETLTKIAKKYGVTVVSILNVNPSLTEDNLNPEQILRIPNTSNKKILISSETKDNDLKPKAQVNQKLIPKSGNYHIVEKGQTLYAISKLYGVSVADLQKWNQLKDVNVKIGGLLVVVSPDQQKNTKVLHEIPAAKQVQPENNQQSKPAEKPLPNSDVEEIQESDEDITEKPDIQASNNENQKQLSMLFKEKALSGSKQMVKGTGAPMTTTLGAMETVYFAMHKTLPIGTIIKIKNLVNSKIVYAKVIGKLPETDENKHVIVRYSLGVKKDLQLQNGKCYVQIEYSN